MITYRTVPYPLKRRRWMRITAYHCPRSIVTGITSGQVFNTQEGLFQPQVVLFWNSDSKKTKVKKDDES